MSSISLSNLVILVLVQLQLVLSDYDCLCYYGIEKTVYDNASHSNTVGYLYEFDCKPLEDRDADGHFGVSFDHKFGYVAKDDENLQIQVCPGAPPAADILIRTTAPIVTSSTTATVPAPIVTSSPTAAIDAPIVTSSTTATIAVPIETSSPTAVIAAPLVTSSTTATTAANIVTISTSATTTAPIILSSTTATMNAYASTESSISTSSLPHTKIHTSQTHTRSRLTSILSTVSASYAPGTAPSAIQQGESKTASLVSSPSVSTTTESAKTISASSNTPDSIGYTDIYMTSTSAYEFHQNSAYENIVSPETEATQPSETAYVSSLFTTTSGQIFTTNANTSSLSATVNPTIFPATEESRPTTFNIDQNSSGGVMKFPDMCFTETTASQTTDDLISGHVDLCPYKFLAESIYVNGTYPLFRQHGQYCYEVRNVSTTWREAERDCQHRGGFLVSIQNYSTLRLLKDLIQRLQPSNNYWIGLTNPRNAWEWANGDKFECSSTWNVDGTNDVPSCILMSSLDGSWTKSECSADGKMSPWICQYKID